MAWFTLQSLFVIILAFLLGLLVGRLVGVRRRHGPEPALDPKGPVHYQVPVQYQVPAQAEPPDEATLAAQIELPTEIELPIEIELRTEIEPHTEIEPPADDALPPQFELLTEVDVPGQIELPSQIELPAQQEPSERFEAPVAPAQPAPASAGPASAAPAAADRLERIEGIGPKIANALRAAGITTFASLAAADEHTLREALHAAGVRVAPSLPTWPGQARLLADRNETGFTALTAGLIRGRDSSGVS